MVFIKLFFVFSSIVLVINGQQPFTLPPNNSIYGSGVAAPQIPNIASASNEGIQALVFKLFDNMTVDSNIQNAISEYARLSDNPSTPINQLIQGKQKLLNSLPQQARKVLEDSFSRQRSNMQDYLEDTRSQLDKNKNAASNEAFRNINEVFAAYLSAGQVSNEMTGNYICNAIKQLCNSNQEISKITTDHFKFNPATPNYDTICQQQLFGFLVTAQGGTGTASEMIEKVKSKLSQWASNVQNTASNAANSIYGAANGAVNDIRNTMGNAADSIRNTFSGNNNNNQYPPQNQYPQNTQG
jgi:vacuolar-type H+-ATPase subunit H